MSLLELAFAGELHFEECGPYSKGSVKTSIVSEEAYGNTKKIAPVWRQIPLCATIGNNGIIMILLNLHKGEKIKQWLNLEKICLMILSIMT
jgi:hypothetical protein